MVSITSTLKDKVKLLTFQIIEINNSSKDETIWEAIDTLTTKYKSEYKEFLECKPLLEQARKLYKAVGIEPSRYRPASEALIKRIINGKALFQINSLVDFGNYCSLLFMTPVGLYDMQKIKFPINVRLGEENEKYEGLGKAEVLLKNKLVLADENGPFGNPSSDSKRTSVTLQTSNSFFVYYFHKSVENERIEVVGEKTKKLINKFFSPQKIILNNINL